MQQVKTANRRASRRGFWTQISAVLIQPVAFFRDLPRMEESRQWLAIALLILGLIGLSAIQQSGQSAGNDTLPQQPPVMDMGGMGDPFGGMPPDMGAEPAAATGGNTDNWSIGLITAAGLLLAWGVQAIILSEVTLLKGRSPQLGRNMQVAIWASAPLALMALLQVVFISTGGEIGKAGLSGLIVESGFYADSSEFVRKLLIALTSNLTIFWLWSLGLLYLGARHTLNGKWWSASLVVVIWVAVLTIAPVITDQIDLADYEPAPIVDEMMPPMEGEFMPPLEEFSGESEMP